MKTRSMRAGGSQRRTARASPGVQAHVVEPLLLDGRQRLDDAVLEWLAADQADFGLCRACQTSARRRRSRSRATSRAPGLGVSKSDSRQIVAQQRRLRSLGLRPRRRPYRDLSAMLARVSGIAGHAAAGTKNTSTLLREPLFIRSKFASAAHWLEATRLLGIASARSVFSQEKPPSLSGARPKWP